MKITTSSSLRGLKADVLVLGWFENQKLISHVFWSQIPASAKTAIQKQLKRPGNSLEWGSQTVVQLPKGPWGNIVVVGLGKKDDWSARRNRMVTRRVVRQALGGRWSTIVFAFQDLSVEGVARAAENALLASYEYRLHKQAPKIGWPEITTVTLVAKNVTKEYAAAVKRGMTIGEMVNHARDLANMPGGLMTPTTLAAEATIIAKNRKLSVKVLTPTEMKKLGMGALLGVGNGSTEEPRLIVVEYRGRLSRATSSTAKGGSHSSLSKEGADRPLVFVGKGITFDSGGYNLKPGASMNEMHMDMAGGAAALSAIAAIADLKLPVNVVTIVPAAENMVSGSGFRPGDILKSMSGVNIEIGNTDAEGRLVLADGLSYAQKFYKPAVLVDVATLTGAALVALGQEATALLTRNMNLQVAGQEIGEVSGDYVWPLPMWEEYDSLVKATFGDITNSGKARWGGTIEGAIFLARFVKDVPWVHLDIAPTMSSIDGQGLAPGATGAGVRWMVELAQRMADGKLQL